MTENILLGNLRNVVTHSEKTGRKHIKLEP